MSRITAWLSAITLFLCLSLLPAGSAFAQSGDQVINGTRVHTEIFASEGYAVFSNSCGSQRISQGALQNGAIPNQIIPCPRPQQKSTYLPPAQSAPTQSDERPMPPSYWADPPERKSASRPDSSGASKYQQIAPSSSSSDSKLTADQATCKKLTAMANTCLDSMKTAASGQGGSFKDCVALNCSQMTKLGCAPQAACTYGVSSIPSL